MGAAVYKTAAPSVSRLNLAIVFGHAAGKENQVMKASVTGTVLAIAAATMFVASSVLAQETKGPAGRLARVKCVGANDCKGQSNCKTASNTKGPGENSCKGQGMLMTLSEKACKDKGGHVMSTKKM